MLEDLDAAYRETQELRGSRWDFRQMTLTALMDYIVSTHHAYLQKTLPELSRLVTTILRVHGANHKELSRVHKRTDKLLEELESDLLEHIHLENNILHPRLRLRH